MRESGSNTVVAIAAVVALALGGAGGYALGMNKDDGGANNNATNGAPTSMSEAADLRVVLNNLETEHVALAAAATRAGFDGADNFDAAAGSLSQNTDDISAAVGDVYGDEAEERFKEIWASHIGFFVDYTLAAKAGDQAGMDEAVENLNGYVDAISTFFSEANPNLPKEAVAQLISEHVGLLKGAVDAYGAGDFEESYAQQREAERQISGIADTLSGAIVEQKPEEFSGSN